MCITRFLSSKKIGGGVLLVSTLLFGVLTASEATARMCSISHKGGTGCEDSVSMAYKSDKSVCTDTGECKRKGYGTTNNGIKCNTCSGCDNSTLYKCCSQTGDNVYMVPDDVYGDASDKLNRKQINANIKTWKEEIQNDYCGAVGEKYIINEDGRCVRDSVFNWIDDEVCGECSSACKANQIDYSALINTQNMRNNTTFYKYGNSCYKLCPDSSLKFEYFEAGCNGSAIGACCSAKKADLIYAPARGDNSMCKDGYKWDPTTCDCIIKECEVAGATYAPASNCVENANLTGNPSKCCKKTKSVLEDGSNDVFTDRSGVHQPICYHGS